MKLPFNSSFGTLRGSFSRNLSFLIMFSSNQVFIFTTGWRQESFGTTGSKWKHFRFEFGLEGSWWWKWFQFKNGSGKWWEVGEIESSLSSFRTWCENPLQLWLYTAGHMKIRRIMAISVSSWCDFPSIWIEEIAWNRSCMWHLVLHLILAVMSWLHFIPNACELEYFYCFGWISLTAYFFCTLSFYNWRLF